MSKVILITPTGNTIAVSAKEAKLRLAAGVGYRKLDTRDVKVKLATKPEDFKS